MRVIRAEILGLCFGVRDALRVISAVSAPERTTILGELVHNPLVLAEIGRIGFRSAAERDRERVPQTPNVLITAHGISDRRRASLQAAGKRLIDTTCPLVSRVHQVAQRLARDGYHILLIGHAGHVEVEGIVEDLESFDVISTPEDVTTYSQVKLGVISQSTTPETLADEVRRAAVALNPQADIRYVDTICHPTKEHQRALDRLLDQVSNVVVVGGRNSNNTRELVRRCRERDAMVQHVESASEIDRTWFDGMETVGLTAGTSTLDATIDEVHEVLSGIESTPRLLRRGGF